MLYVHGPKIVLTWCYKFSDIVLQALDWYKYLWSEIRSVFVHNCQHLFLSHLMFDSFSLYCLSFI